VFDLGPGLDIAWGVIGVVGSFAAIGALLWICGRGYPEREAEDRAREFYDRHGHWPDEDRVTAP